ncbi:MAG TPA: response regulator [Polyangiaceae bacterium]|nr:response regulator [Polyangiaceae bacterium]
MNVELRGAGHDLSVVAIVSDGDAIEIMSRTLRQSGDQLSVATDLAEGLVRISSQVPDVAFVDVTLGDGAGLAVLHHIRALAPNVTVFALTNVDRLPLGVQAASLGSAGTLVMPLSGDELLNALSDVRTRHAERDERFRLERAAAASARHAALVEQVAEIAESASRREAAERLTAVLVNGVGVLAAAVYVPAAEGSRQLMRVASLGNLADAPSFCDEMELLNHARERNLETIRLALKREQSGIVLLGRTAEGAHAASVFPLLPLLTAQATTALALIGAREQSHRGAMKDPSSSAYTFAYFVDVAGREIDMARRHGRRFALATIGVQFERASMGEVEPTVLVAEHVLSAVRDTDVLARVDANEFYLLLPETGGLGAHTCRRRVLDELSEQVTGVPQSDLVVTVGVASFPHDGGDLSRLLRVAKQRAEASLNSAVHQLSLRDLSIPGLVDALLSRPARESTLPTRGVEYPHYIELPAMDLVGLALAAVSEAWRAGQARVVASVHAGISVGGAVRAEHARDGEGLRFDAVDVSALEGCANLDVLCIVAEHSSYVLLGRTEGNVVRAVHAADPLLVDLVLSKLSEATDLRLND